MHKPVRFTLAAALCAALALGGLFLSPAPGKADLSRASAVSCPVVKLKHWQASGQNEKLAFLFGFATMLELERDWQHGQALPISRSINQSWVKGLSGKTLGDIAGAIDAYVEKHPDRLEEPVLKVIGRMYVRPALSPAERREAGDRYEQIRKGR